MGKAPEHHEASDYEVLMRVLERARTLVRQNGLHVLLAVLVLVAAVVLYRTHHVRRQSRAHAAWELLGSLDDPSYAYMASPLEAEQALALALAQVTEALANPADARTIPWLLLKQGSLLTAGGRWDEALEVYRRIVREYPDAGELAEPAMAVVLEAAGRYEESAALRERLAADSADHWVDAGRCRELAGDLAGAQASYRKALDAGLSDSLRELAADRLAALERGEPLPAPPEEPEPEPEAPALIVPQETPFATGTADPAPPGAPALP